MMIGINKSGNTAKESHNKFSCGMLQKQNSVPTYSCFVGTATKILLFLDKL
ncbi:hypothetical protein HMPREF1870_01707 [Bacteroidales bacterium KA00344]|nr:hypothetical protein HMPREF1870_01707 [Bacteroidales bacterium KA00344]